jgi:hypothetical protein
LLLLAIALWYSLVFPLSCKVATGGLHAKPMHCPWLGHPEMYAGLLATAAEVTQPKFPECFAHGIKWTNIIYTFLHLDCLGCKTAQISWEIACLWM